MIASRPGVVVAYVLVSENANCQFVWNRPGHEVPMGNRAVVELRRIPSPLDKSRYEFMAFFSSPPPTWWGPAHKIAVDGVVMQNQNSLTQKIS